MHTESALSGWQPAGGAVSDARRNGSRRRSDGAQGAVGFRHVRGRTANQPPVIPIEQSFSSDIITIATSESGARRRALREQVIVDRRLV